VTTDALADAIHEARCGPVRWVDHERVPWQTDHREWDIATAKALVALGVTLATPTPDTLDVERLVRAEHLWCVQVEGACHKPEAHRKQAEFILAALAATREEMP